MRKVFLFMMVSLDGYFEGPNHDLSWHNVDEEFNEYAIDQTKNVGILIFGRRTYELMSDYWPTESARRDDPAVANLMNTTPKVVFSKTLRKLSPILHWENVRLVNKNPAGEVRRLKKERGNDIAIYGSNNLTVSLMNHNLVDEFRIMVNPVATGAGTPLFKGLKKELKLQLLDTKIFKSGNVLLSYRPVNKI